MQKDTDRLPGDGLLAGLVILAVMGGVMLSMHISESMPRWKSALQTFGIRTRLRGLFKRR